MANRDRKFLVEIRLRAEVEAEDQADALANAAIKVKYGFEGVEAPSLRVVTEITPPPSATQQENKPEAGPLHPVIADALKTLVPPAPRPDGSDIPF